MKFVLFLCGLALAAASQEWESFKAAHGKAYANVKEEMYRKTVFQSHLKFIEEHNARFQKGEVTFTVAVNKFADLTTEEFVSQMTGYEPSEEGLPVATFSDVARADSWDWRDKGAVTPVKDQGQCGSCWSFSTTGTLEGAYFVKTGTLYSLSEQQLVDCDSTNHGCSGGRMDRALTYIKSNGITTESTYPYVASQRTCTYNPATSVVKASGYVKISSGSESSLQSGVHDHGPVSVAIDCGHTSFQLYSSGVYYEPACSSTRMNHAVLTVGYGAESGSDYWLVKNSWGGSWGMSGYIKMARNRSNHCGIASDALYATV